MASISIITDTHVYFYSGREHYSNWHVTPGQFRYPRAQTLFDCSERAFMWEKATFFGDHMIAHAILLAKDPRETKELGRKVQGYDDKVWTCVREGLMANVCLAKYSQNPAWAAELKATDKRILVEASPVDRIWGCGLDVETAASGAPWNGLNLLGESLMTVRGLL